MRHAIAFMLETCLLPVFYSLYNMSWDVELFLPVSFLTLVDWCKWWAAVPGLGGKATPPSLEHGSRGLPGACWRQGDRSYGVDALLMKGCP